MSEAKTIADRVQAAIDGLNDVLLRLDGHADAAEPAFDEIVKLCGLAETWEYPGQVIRDVRDALKTRDDEIADLKATGAKSALRIASEFAAQEIKERDDEIATLKQVAADDHDRRVREAQAQFARIAELEARRIHVEAETYKICVIRDKLATDLAAVIEQNQKLQAALIYARDRRGNWFDFDEWIIQVEHALDNKLPPHAVENAQAKEAQAWAAITSMREQRDAMREQLRIAEAVRDDARAASQRYLDEKREVEERLRKAVVDWRLEVDALQVPQVTKRKDGAYTAGPPSDGRSVDEHLDELTAPRADGVVVRIPGAELFIDQTPACECSLKYREIAPGIHSKYCPLGGLPLEDGRKRWRCEPCDLTYRSPADTPTQPIANCQQCGKPTTEVPQ